MMADEVDLDQLRSMKMLVVTPTIRLEYTGIDCNRSDGVIKVKQGVTEEMQVAAFEEQSVESNNNIKNTADTTDYAIESEYETGNEPGHIWTTIKTESIDEEQVGDDIQCSDSDYDSSILHSIIKTEPESIQYNGSHDFLTAIQNERSQSNAVKEPTSDLSPTKKPGLRRTKRIQTDVLLSKCDVCKTPFTKENTQDSHVCVSLDATPYECDVCNHRFRAKNTLERHLRTHIGTGKFECDVCLKRFKWSGNLITHIKTHSGLKPYKCDVCKKSFNSKSNLTKHLRIHSNKKFKCEVCNILISREDNLRTHMRIHTGEKRFECDVCHQAFLRQVELDKHTFSHDVEKCGRSIKRYKCYECEISFYTKNDLVRHSLKHTGTKPFKCNVCDKSFTRKDSLYAHLRLHAKKTPYECKKCEKYFISKTALARHIRDVDHTISA